MSWWCYTDPNKTGICDRCERPAAEHSHTCVACYMNPSLRAKSKLAPGNVASFPIHSYKDHPPGMRHSSMNLCYCPASAIPAPPPLPVPVAGAPAGTVGVVQPSVVVRPAGAAPVMRPTTQPPSPGEHCECSSCAGCTQGTECFRPPEGGCGGKCIVCYGLGLIGAPAPQAPQMQQPVVQIIQPQVIQIPRQIIQPQVIQIPLPVPVPLAPPQTVPDEVVDVDVDARILEATQAVQAMVDDEVPEDVQP